MGWGLGDVWDATGGKVVGAAGDAVNAATGAVSDAGGAVWDGTKWVANKADNLVHGRWDDPTNPYTTPADLNPENLRQDPLTGLWIDPATSNIYQRNADGKYYAVHDLGMRAQVAKNIATADSYSGLAKDFNESVKSTMGGQQSLADAYRRTISDPNAPSVSREQLNQALQAADATQLSQAAGASGANAFIARRTAANNMASLNAKAGASAAELRAGEVANAQKGLAETYNALGTEGLQGYGMNTGLGLNYATLGANQEGAANTNETVKSGQNKQLGVAIGPPIVQGAANAIAPAAPAGAAGAASGA